VWLAALTKACPNSRLTIDRDHGWAAFIQQGARHCALSGIILDRPKLDVTWEAVATFTNLSPSPGQPKELEAFIFFPEEFTHELEFAWNHFDNVSKIPDFNSFPEHRRKPTGDAATGFNIFTRQPTFLPASIADVSTKRSNFETAICAERPHSNPSNTNPNRRPVVRRPRLNAHLAQELFQRYLEIRSMSRGSELSIRSQSRNVHLEITIKLFARSEHEIPKTRGKMQTDGTFV
jgi:hypothetical protein